MLKSTERPDASASNFQNGQNLVCLLKKIITVVEIIVFIYCDSCELPTIFNVFGNNCLLLFFLINNFV